MKKCSKCGEPKPLDQFYRKTASKSGVRSECKFCTNIRSTQWGKNNLERKKALGRKSGAKARIVRSSEFNMRSRECNAKSYKNDPDKWRKRSRDWKENNPERARRSDRKQSLRKYGLTETDWQTMLDRQNGVCAICANAETVLHQNGVTRRLAVDHCHATGAARGLLCSKCNHGLGNFDDNPELLLIAAEYLRRYGKRMAA